MDDPGASGEQQRTYIWQNVMNMGYGNPKYLGPNTHLLYSCGSTGEEWERCQHSETLARPINTRRRRRLTDMSVEKVYLCGRATDGPGERGGSASRTCASARRRVRPGKGGAGGTRAGQRSP